MEGRQEGVEPLDRAHDLSSLSGEVEAVARGDRSMQQCPLESRGPPGVAFCSVAQVATMIWTRRILTMRLSANSAA